jgi:hypothetical protein
MRLGSSGWCQSGAVLRLRGIFFTHRPSPTATQRFGSVAASTSLEAMILDSKWTSLFSEEERRLAGARLRDYGFTGPLPDAERK